MVFHVLVPGKPVVPPELISQTDASHWVLQLEDFAAIAEVVCFLSAPLAPDAALGVHITAPPFDAANWHYLGCLTNACPSAVFKPRYVWSSRDARPTTALVGLELAPAAQYSARPPEMASDEVTEVAKLIARDMVTYLASFENPGPQTMDGWLGRFNERCRREGVNWLRRTD